MNRSHLAALLAAVLGTLTGAARLSAADKPEPTDDKLLFEGPVAGTAVVRRPFAQASQEIKGTILYVAKDAVYIRPTRGTAVDIIDTPRHTISYVTAVKDGKKLYWDWDEAKKEIRGTTAPPNAPAVPTPAVSAKSEPKYLFFALERLQERIDQAIAQSDDTLLKYIGDRADVVREHAEKERMDPKLVGLYADAADYIEKQSAVSKERREFLDKHMEKVEENSIKDREAALRAEMVKTEGLGQYFRGAFPRVTVSLRGRWGYASYDFGGAMAGVATMIRGQQQYELEALRIRFAKSLLGKEKERMLDDLSDRQAKMKEARLRQIADVGAEAFGLPKAKDSLETRALAADMQARNDFRSLLDVLENRASAERRGDDAANPFTLLDSYHTASQLKEKTRVEQAEKLFTLALKAVDAAKFVPDGRVYDPDRADVLRSAAGLACMAAMLDSPDDSWRAAYSPKAAYAVRLLERAKTFNLDQGGQVREQLAVAYALAGRHGEAVRLAEEIKGTRKGSVGFLLTLVRLLSINDNHKDAMDALQDAIGQGYNDVAFIGKNEDFTALRRDAARFAAFTKPQFSAFWVLPKDLNQKLTPNRFEIVNNSAFPVTDVRLTLRVELRGQQKPLTFTKTVSQIEKGEKVDWDNVFSESPARVYQIKMTIDTDQGKFTPERLQRK